MHDKDFHKNVETRLDIWDHLATIFLYSYELELCVYYAWKRTSKILKSIYIHIYWIFCDLVVLRYQTWFISSWPRLSWVLWECSNIVNYYTYYFGGLVAHPCFFFITQQQIEKMNRTKLPIRKQLGNVPQFPVGVDAVTAEVGSTNRLGFQLLMYQTYVYLWIVIMAKNM